MIHPGERSHDTKVIQENSSCDKPGVSCSVPVRELASLTWIKHANHRPGGNDSAKQPTTLDWSCWCIIRKFFTHTCCGRICVILLIQNTFFSPWLNKSSFKGNENNMEIGREFCLFLFFLCGQSLRRCHWIISGKLFHQCAGVFDQSANPATEQNCTSISKENKTFDGQQTYESVTVIQQKMLNGDLRRPKERWKVSW